MDSYFTSWSFPQLLRKQTFLIIAKHLPRKLRERGSGTGFFFGVNQRNTESDVYD